MFKRDVEIGERARHVFQISGLAVALQQSHPEAGKFAVALRRHDGPGLLESGFIEAIGRKAASRAGNAIAAKRAG